MKKFCKYYEKGKWLLQICNDGNSFDILLHKGATELFWWRHAYTFKPYFELIIWKWSYFKYLKKRK